MKRYIKINLPTWLAEKIKPFLAVNGGAYRSISEFVNEATRLRIEQLSKEQPLSGDEA